MLGKSYTPVTEVNQHPQAFSDDAKAAVAAADSIHAVRINPNNRSEVEKVWEKAIKQLEPSASVPVLNPPVNKIELSNRQEFTDGELQSVCRILLYYPDTTIRDITATLKVEEGDVANSKYTRARLRFLLARGLVSTRWVENSNRYSLTPTGQRWIEYML